MKLAKLNPRIATVDLRRTPAIETTNNIERKRGRFVQDRRLRLWKRDPHCAHCRTLVDFLPSEFQIDHKIELQDGGADDDNNCRVLCTACHVQKTNDEKERRR